MPLLSDVVKPVATPSAPVRKTENYGLFSIFQDVKTMQQLQFLSMVLMTVIPFLEIEVQLSIVARFLEKVNAKLIILQFTHTQFNNKW